MMYPFLTINVIKSSFKSYEKCSELSSLEIKSEVGRTGGI